MNPPTADPIRALRCYAIPALAFLVLTLLAGMWLRTALLAPPALLGFRYANLVHAHSHIAFFGWLTLALFAQLGAAAPLTAARRRLLAAHAALAGLASVAAFLAFLAGGYSMPAIALSSLHVALWIAFVAVVARGLPRGGTVAALRHAALAFLVIAGLGTLAPLTVLLRGTTDPWTSELAVKLFLVPFLSGWALLGAMAAVYGSAVAPRAGRLALPLIACGVLPSTLLFVAAPAPHPLLPLVGRAGTVLVALGTLAFALDVLRTRAISGWLRMAGAGALLKAAAELGAAAGLAGPLLHSTPVVLAHLHLTLLGFLTPALLGAILPRGPGRGAAALFAGGTAVMLLALLASGWPWLLGVSMALGADLLFLLRAAWAGGAAVLAGVLLALRNAFSHRRIADPVRAAGYLLR